MNKILLFLLFIVPLHASKKHYPLTNEPIDVVLVTHPKDKVALQLCIKGIRNYGENIGRVIVVSSEPLSDDAEWFNEKLYPFSKDDVALEIGRGDPQVRDAFFNRGGHPVGWFYQQLLKLYAAYVIPDISSNILVLDSDSVFISDIAFLNRQHGGLLCIKSKNPTKSHYVQHAIRMLPSYHPIYPEYNSVNHHMLFQKPILDDLFQEIEEHRQLPLWKVFCREVDITRKFGSGSEYELYFNFALNHTSQVSIREIHRRASADFSKINLYKSLGYELVSFHSYMRK